MYIFYVLFYVLYRHLNICFKAYMLMLPVNVIQVYMTVWIAVLSFDTNFWALR